jgi:hypothetical protein
MAFCQFVPATVRDTRPLNVSPTRFRCHGTRITFLSTVARAAFCGNAAKVRLVCCPFDDLWITDLQDVFTVDDGKPEGDNTSP